MKLGRRLIKKIPGARAINRLIKNNAVASDVFTKIFERNAWGGHESRSGRGSDLDQTRVLIDKLPDVFREFGVRSLLDIPCGDFNWMRHLDLDGVAYIGADIVEEVIRHNNDAYRREGVEFRRLNLLEDKLPQVDLVLCRDCLVHLSYRQIGIALGRICDSRSKWLLATTFTDRTANHDIAMGEWRPLNLTLPPWQLPAPRFTLVEQCTEDNGIYRDKSLGLWSMSDIRASLGIS
jgi:hypothetical protein